MPVPVQTPIASAIANGVTTVFPYAYTVLQASDVTVTGELAGVVTTYSFGTHYTLSGVGTDAGSVNFLVAPLVGTIITSYRDSELARATDYQNGGDLQAETLDLDFNRLWLALQEIFNGAKGVPNALRVPSPETLPPLPPAASRDGYLLGFAGGSWALVPGQSGSATSLALDLAKTTDVAKGDALIGVKQPFTGAVARTQHDKNAESVSVKDFGAVGDGTTDDTAAIQLAINASQRVYFPPGQYRITASLKWANQYLFGCVDNGTFSTALNQTMIVCDGTFPAFKFEVAGGFSVQGGGIENFNIYFADGTRPATAATRPDAWGVYIDDVGGTIGYPGWFKLSNITVRGGMGVVHDFGGSWMAEWDHLHGEACFAGFHKKFGTTIVAKNCFSRGAFQSWRIESCLGFTMIGCAYDLSDFGQVVNGYLPCYISESNVTISAMDIESPFLSGDQNALMWADNNSVVHVSGLRVLDAQITGAPNIYLFKASNSAKLLIDALDCRTPAYSETPGLFAYFAAISSGVINVRGASLPAVTGVAPSNPLAGTATGGQIQYTGAISAYPWFGNACRTDESVRFSVSETIGNIVASGTGSPVSRSYSVPGAAIGDYAHVSLSTPIQAGLLIHAFVSSADTVTVELRNPTASTITLPAAITRIRVVREIDP